MFNFNFKLFLLNLKNEAVHHLKCEKYYVSNTVFANANEYEILSVFWTLTFKFCHCVRDLTLQAVKTLLWLICKQILNFKGTVKEKWKGV